MDVLASATIHNSLDCNQWYDLPLQQQVPKIRVLPYA